MPLTNLNYFCANSKIYKIPNQTTCINQRLINRKRIFYKDVVFKKQSRFQRINPVCGSVGDENPVPQDQLQMLERMIKLTPEDQNNLQSENEIPQQEQRQSCYIHNLPLWRVQWAQFPGQMEILNVHVPHYVDMFNRLMEGPKPWYFGHLYLPEGSKNLSNPEFELQEGTAAPMIGTLMKITHAVRMPKGELLIIACGLQRFKVVRKRQTLPYQSADVKLVMDKEELQMFSTLSETLIETASSTVQQQSEAILEMSVSWNKMYWELETYLLRNISNQNNLQPVDEPGAAIKILNELQDVNCLEVIPLNPDDYNNQDLVSGAVKQGMLHLFDPQTTQINQDDENLEDLLQKMVMIQNSVNEQLGVFQPYLDSLLLLEKEIWDSLTIIEELVQKITNQKEVYSQALLCLRSMRNQPNQYPEIRRLQRLSYFAALALPDFDVQTPNAFGEARQKFLEAESIEERFKLVQKRLQEIREYIHYFVE